MRIAERLFRVVLRLFPSEFRERFGGDMEALYRDARGDAAMRGRRGAAGFWLGVAGDALVRAPGAHMRMTLYDLKFAARALRRSPMFTCVAVLTLALGIGANTAIFSVVHAVALQQLPYKDSDRLVRFWEDNNKLHIPQFSASVLNYLSWRERARSFEALGAWQDNAATITSGGDPQRLADMQATASLLPLLRIRPIAGRTFTAEEDRPGAAHVTLIAESVWRDRFGSNPDTIGSAIVLDGLPYTVIGIVRDRDFTFPVKLVTPLAADPAKEDRSNHMVTAVGRLRAGVTLAQAQQEMDAIAVQLGRDYPNDDADWGVTLVSFYDWIVPQSVRTGLYLLLASVGLVLLIACTNIANLTLARAALRRREQAVRLALGASRTRVIREVLTECVLVALIGGGVGLVLAYWSVPIFQARLAGVLPRAGDIRLDAPVLIFAMAVSILTGLLFGALPAFLNSRGDVIGALKESTGGSGARHQGLARRLLVVGQLALATILLAGAALLIQSFIRMQRVDLGFQPERVTTAMVGLPATRYPDQPASWQFYKRVIGELESTAGIEAVGLSSSAPMSGGNTGEPVRAQGPNALGPNELEVDWRMVSPDYFKAMNIPILRGRPFGDGDRRGGTRAMILSADTAKRFWPNEDAVGHTIIAGGPFLVVGVVGDVRNLNQSIDPRPTMYLSTTQFVWPAMTFVVRARTDMPVAAVLRKAVNGIDPQLAVFAVKTMDTMLDNGAAQPRLTAWMVGLFASLALLLAAIGVYGVLAYLVTQRTREIGLRVALGAQPSSVRRLVVGHSLRLAAIGVAAGIGGTLLLAPAIRSQLYGIRPRDGATLAGVSAALLAVALVASYLPARRATRVDPLKALRAE